MLTSGDCLTTFPPKSGFFYSDTATTPIYTLSLHDALPICEQRQRLVQRVADRALACRRAGRQVAQHVGDRKSTRLNSSHSSSSYAVFCLKKKNCPGSRASITEVRAQARKRLLEGGRWCNAL